MSIKNVGILLVIIGVFIPSVLYPFTTVNDRAMRMQAIVASAGVLLHTRITDLEIVINEDTQESIKVPYSYILALGISLTFTGVALIAIRKDSKNGGKKSLETETSEYENNRYKPNIISVLIVDDEPGIRESLTEYLEQQTNWIIHTASNDNEALGLLKHNQYNLVSTDNNHPPLGGGELCRLIKGLYPDTKVFVYSGYIEQMNEIIEAGADYYAKKPILLENYLKVLKRMICSYHRRS